MQGCVIGSFLSLRWVISTPIASASSSDAVPPFVVLSMYPNSFTALHIISFCLWRVIFLHTRLDALYPQTVAFTYCGLYRIIFGRPQSLFAIVTAALHILKTILATSCFISPSLKTSSDTTCATLCFSISLHTLFFRSIIRLSVLSLDVSPTPFNVITPWSVIRPFLYMAQPVLWLAGSRAKIVILSIVLCFIDTYREYV